MSAIWMDPAEVRASAAALGELALQVQETVTGTRSTCQCEVPRSLMGWLDEQLQTITVSALEVALSYITEAADTMRRADELLAEQSLVAAVEAPASGAPAVTGGPVWDARYGWVSTAPLPGPLTAEQWKIAAANGHVDAGAGGGGTWDQLASISNAQSAAGLNAIDGVIGGSYKADPSTLTVAEQYTGNLNTGSRPYAPPPKPPSALPHS